MKILLKKHTMIFGLVVLPMLIGCEDYLDLPLPTDKLYADGVFERDATTAAAIDGIFPQITIDIEKNVADNYRLIGFYVDELKLIDFSTAPNEYFNNLNATNAPDTFYKYYSILYPVNTVIEGIEKSSAPLEHREQYLGEVYFMRAWIYMFLTNIYGDVPLVLTTDPNVIQDLGRSSQEAIYAQILADLQLAQELLPEGYLDKNGDAVSSRYRPNKSVVHALMARYYLYNEEWDKAEEMAAMVLNNNSINYALTVTSETFKNGSISSIWALQTSTSGGYTRTREANIYLKAFLESDERFISQEISDGLFNSFEDGDLRKQDWIREGVIGENTYRIPYKYQSLKENIADEVPIYLRLAEQYLIRAESRARLGNISGAQADLNALRAMRGLDNTTALDQNELIDAILTERRHELFLEDGHRWFDLRRTAKLDELMEELTPIKSNGLYSWAPYKKYWPVTNAELQTNTNMEQTEGY